MALPESSSLTTAKHKSYSNPLEAQANNLKTNFMKMIDVF